MSVSKYQPESPDRAYSDDIPVRHEYPTYADDAQFFDIDISLPLSPTDITPVASSDDDDTEDEFDLDSFFCKPKPTNPNQCISPPAENLFHEGQLPPLDDTDKDIPFPQSCNVPGVKIQFPKLLKSATKLKISLLGFKKSAKPGTDLQSPSAEHGVAMDSPVPKQNRFVTLKLKVVEVPLVSLFTRDNSNGSKRVDKNHGGLQEKSEDSEDGQGQCKNMDREKKGTKEIVQKYVQKIKPLYLKISQRYNEKIRFRDQEKTGERNGVKNGRSPGLERKLEKQMSFSYFSGNLKMIHKHLAKGKHQPSDMQQKLRNYSSESTLMEIESAIQGAISHCKQSSCIYDTVTCSNSGCSAESYEGSDGR